MAYITIQRHGENSGLKFAQTEPDLYDISNSENGLLKPNLFSGKKSPLMNESRLRQPELRSYLKRKVSFQTFILFLWFTCGYLAPQASRR